jgi:hypothetical protein
VHAQSRLRRTLNIAPIDRLQAYGITRAQPGMEGSDKHPERMRLGCILTPRGLGSGYSIGLEPVDGGNVQSSPQATLRVHVAPLSRWFDGTPVLLLCDTLEIFGVVSIVLGCAQLFAERS